MRPSDEGEDVIQNMKRLDRHIKENGQKLIDLVALKADKVYYL